MLSHEHTGTTVILLHQADFAQSLDTGRGGVIWSIYRPGLYKYSKNCLFLVCFSIIGVNTAA